MKSHRQMWDGSMPRPKRNATKKNKKPRGRVSDHTLRFRRDASPPLRVRNLVSLGAKPRKGRGRFGWAPELAPKYALRSEIASGFTAAFAFAAALLTRPSMLSRRQQKVAP